MTTMPMAAAPAQPVQDEEIPDFTGRTETVKFRMYGRLFEAAPTVPTKVAFRLMDLGRGLGSAEISADEQFERLAEFFRRTLLSSSAETFVAWMDSSDTPIGLSEAVKLMEWLMSQWGLTPTQPSSDSSETLEGTGPSSAVIALPTESPVP